MSTRRVLWLGPSKEQWQALHESARPLKGVEWLPIFHWGEMLNFLSQGGAWDSLLMGPWLASGSADFQPIDAAQMVAYLTRVRITPIFLILEPDQAAWGQTVGHDCVEQRINHPNSPPWAKLMARLRKDILGEVQTNPLAGVNEYVVVDSRGEVKDSFQSLDSERRSDLVSFFQVKVRALEAAAKLGKCRQVTLQSLQSTSSLMMNSSGPTVFLGRNQQSQLYPRQASWRDEDKLRQLGVTL